jgi:hypothetical protein
MCHNSLKVKYCNVGCKDTNNKKKMSNCAVCFNRICEMDFLPKEPETKEAFDAF